MTAPHDLDRQLHAFLADGPTELPNSSFDAVRDRIDAIGQRVLIGPWRLPVMNKFVPIGLGAAAAVVALVLGAQLLAPPALLGPGASATSSVAPSATAEPSVAAPSPTPSPTPTPPPPLTETFTSERHGISIAYPTGWVTRPATEPWTTSVPDFISTAGDVVHDPVRQGNLWIAVASQPIGDSAPDEWVAEKLALDDGCLATEPIAVDGATGSIGFGDCTRAAVTTDGRGYFIWLYTSGDEPSLSVTYDRVWFEEVLGTVQLLPEDAIDEAPSASP